MVYRHSIYTQKNLKYIAKLLYIARLCSENLILVIIDDNGLER